ncbi:MAG: DUF1549 and DUF1553 domain-containing protein [Aureliella sp.]
MIKDRIAPRLLLCVVAVVAAFAPPAFSADGEKTKPNKTLQQEKSNERQAIQLPLYQRFASEPGNIKQPPTEETPSFQRHVSPLFGRLGCNGRACHGSFQGQGGFQLSLFGYDFKADHDALMDAATGRVDLDDKLESLVLTYPIDADAHGGGKRFDEGGWEYWVIRNWIQAGAKFNGTKLQKLEHLEITPKQVRFQKPGDKRQLRAIAHWEDGTSEDVTCLCRFHSNDSAISQIDASGLITSEGTGDTHVVVSYDKAVVPVQTFLPLSGNSGKNFPRIATSTEVDKLVVAKLRKLGIVPSQLCTDEEFLRRATLDVTGGLPSADDVKDFLADTRPDKRQIKVEELLASPAYTARWTTFFCDMTGNNDDQLRNLLPNGVRVDSQWYHWIRDRIEKNVPYDELVAGIVTAHSRLPGESYRDYCAAMSEVCSDTSGEKFADRPGLVYYWARRDFQSTEDRAIGFAHTFLGVRIQCAQCHKHPFDRWSKDDFDNFEKLFARVQANQRSMQPDAKREYTAMLDELGVDKKLRNNQLRGELGTFLKAGKTIPFPELILTSANRNARNKNKKNRKPAQPPKAKLLGSDWVEMNDADAREYLMDWLRSPENPYFTKAIVNRIWAQYFSVGIINPADDINLANAPSNAPLLDYLAAGFRENNFDLKWLHREILSSDTYQRSWQPNETNAADKHNFSRSLLRRMPAETAIDAVRMALSDDAYAKRATQLDAPRAHLVAGSSNRKLNGRDDTSYALNVFGRNVRESNCDCDRSEESSLLQTVFLLNDASVHKQLTDSRSSWVRQVAAKFDWPAPSASPQNKAKRKQFQELLVRLDEQQVAFEERLAAAVAKGSKRQIEAHKKSRKQQLGRARTRAKQLGYLKEYEQWIASLQTEDHISADEITTKRISDRQATWVTENAYLRTLSRLPTEDELAAASQFLREDENPTDAVAGLLWTLVNTKEFILNH